MLIAMIIIIIFFIIFGFIKDNGLQYLFMIIGFIAGIIENNCMMSYIEKNAYGRGKTSSIELKDSIEGLKKLKQTISKFSTRKEAIDYLINETNLKKDECKEIYDFIMNLDLSNF